MSITRDQLRVGDYMSSEKEFEEWYYVSDKCDTRFDSLENQNAYYKCLETWNHQQAKLDEKDKEIERLKAENERMKIEIILALKRIGTSFNADSIKEDLKRGLREVESD